MGKITWITINEFYLEIDNLLINNLVKNYNYDVNIITNNNNIKKFYLNKGKEVINISNLDIRIKNNLNFFIKKYGFKNPEKSLWQRELLIYGRNIDYLKKSSLEYFTFFEKYFKNFKGTFIHNGDHYFHLIAEIVAKKYGIKVIYHNSIGTFENEIVFGDSWKYNNFYNKKYLLDKINANEKKEIERFIYNKIDKKPLIGGKRKILIFSYFYKLYFYIKNYIFIGRYRKDYKSPFSFIKDFLYRLFNIYINRINYDSFKRIDKKFIFFPMHVIDDAQTTTREYNFINQYKLVQNILKKIPNGYRFVIKEHPHGVGMMNMRKFYNLKKQYDNFYILKPNENAYEIIKKCFSVLTINSDVGYESIILGKKPITIGKSFYSGYGYDIRLDIEKIEKNDLLKILNKENFKINLEDRIKFIYSLKKVHKKGVFFKNSNLEFNLDNDTIEKLSFYINKIIKNNEN